MYRKPLNRRTFLRSLALGSGLHYRLLTDPPMAPFQNVLASSFGGMGFYQSAGFRLMKGWIGH